MSQSITSQPVASPRRGASRAPGCPPAPGRSKEPYWPNPSCARGRCGTKRGSGCIGTCHEGAARTSFPAPQTFAYPRLAWFSPRGPARASPVLRAAPRRSEEHAVEVRRRGAACAGSGPLHRCLVADEERVYNIAVTLLARPAPASRRRLPGGENGWTATAARGERTASQDAGPGKASGARPIVFSAHPHASAPARRGRIHSCSE